MTEEMGRSSTNKSRIPSNQVTDEQPHQIHPADSTQPSTSLLEQWMWYDMVTSIRRCLSFAMSMCPMITPPLDSWWLERCCRSLREYPSSYFVCHSLIVGTLSYFVWMEFRASTCWLRYLQLPSPFLPRRKDTWVSQWFLCR